MFAKQGVLAKIGAVVTGAVLAASIAPLAATVPAAHAVTIKNVSTTNKTLNKLVKSELKAAGVKAGDSQGRALQKAWKRVVKKYRYKSISGNKRPTAKKWAETYAANMYKARKGNCFSDAASFGYLARGLGYKVKVISGTVQDKTHAWVQIRVKGKLFAATPAKGKVWRVFDPNGYREYGTQAPTYNINMGGSAKNQGKATLPYRYYKNNKYSRTL